MIKKQQIETYQNVKLMKEIEIYCCDKCGKELNPGGKWNDGLFLDSLKYHRCSNCQEGIYCDACFQLIDLSPEVECYSGNDFQICPTCVPQFVERRKRLQEIETQMDLLYQERKKMLRGLRERKYQMRGGD